MQLSIITVVVGAQLSFSIPKKCENVKLLFPNINFIFVFKHTNQSINISANINALAKIYRIFLQHYLLI